MVNTIVLLLVLGGAIIMMGAIITTRRLFDQLEMSSYQRRWNRLFLLMIFFFLGYVIALGVLIAEYEYVFQILTGFVFLGGAVFVLLVVNTGLVTIEDLQEQMVAADEAREEAELAQEEAEASRQRAVQLNEYLQATADEYAQIMERCGKGDLTERMAPDGQNDAMDRIATDFNEMIEELEKTTGQLKSFADEVEEAGQVVKDSSDSVRQASEQVADSIQRISEDAAEQKDRLQTVADTMDGVVADLEAVRASNPEAGLDEPLDRLNEISDGVRKMVSLSEETMAESENVAGAAQEQAAELNAVSQRADDLTRYAGPLKDVLERFETEAEHEFYFPTGPGSTPSDGAQPSDE